MATKDTNNNEPNPSTAAPAPTTAPDPIPTSGSGHSSTPPNPKPGHDGATVAPGVSQENVNLIAAALTAANEIKRKAPAPTPNMDKTVPGGMYIVEGQIVTADGTLHPNPPSHVKAAAKQARLNRTDVTFEDRDGDNSPDDEE